jgi:prepilin-type N-terminal cleavage/methylation domain-containing protein
MKKGFTLIEILVSLTIVSFIIAGICGLLSVGNVAYNNDMYLLDLQQQARQAMEGMTRELRQAKIEIGRLITITDGGRRIEFYIPGFSNPIRYYLQSNQVLREHPLGTNKVLANDISELNFCCLGGIGCIDCSTSYIQIRLRTLKTVGQRTFSFPVLSGECLTEKVRLRN